MFQISLQDQWTTCCWAHQIQVLEVFAFLWHHLSHWCFVDKDMEYIIDTVRKLLFYKEINQILLNLLVFLLWFGGPLFWRGLRHAPALPGWSEWWIRSLKPMIECSLLKRRAPELWKPTAYIWVYSVNVINFTSIHFCSIFHIYGNLWIYDNLHIDRHLLVCHAWH